MDAAQSLDMRWDRSQERVTDRVLIPSMPRIVQALEGARRSVDSEMAASVTAVTGHARAGLPCFPTIDDYPIGFCHVIRDGVRSRLRGDPSWRALVRRGVVVRDVFVILKGRFFQNAMQVGNLYVDVANDTVDRAQHWLEWARVRDVEYENPSSIPRIASVATSYYSCTVHPNLHFPEIAPFMPLMAVLGDGSVVLLDFSPVVFMKDLASGFSEFKAWVASGFPGTSPLAAEPSQRLHALCGGTDRFPGFDPCAPDDLLSSADKLCASRAAGWGDDAAAGAFDRAVWTARRLRESQSRVP